VGYDLDINTANYSVIELCTKINNITMGLVGDLLHCIFVRSGFFFNVIFPIMRTVMNTFPSLAIKAAKGDWKSNHVVTDANGATIRVFKKGDKLYPAFGGEKLASVKHLTIRDSDILLAGYPKTGAHWMYEIMYMLVTGKRETSKYGKDLGGFIDPLPNVIIDSLPSPRVLNTHFSYEELPDGIKEKNTKIVVTVRNPKDTCVSYYNHHKNIPVYEYNGEFDAYFKLFMTGEQDYGSYYDATKKWDALAQTPPKENQILMISYEDLKKNPDETVQKVADFLDVTVSAQGIKDILVACGFEKMKAAKSGDAMAGKLFRKGKTGDWKNWLSDAQSDEMDRMWRNKMADCAYEPTY